MEFIKKEMPILGIDGYMKWHQIGSQNAYVAKLDDFEMLKSYRTIVAIFDTKNHIMFVRAKSDYSHPSRTTSKHISQFMSQYWIGSTREVEFTNLRLVDLGIGDIYE